MPTKSFPLSGRRSGIRKMGSVGARQTTAQMLEQEEKKDALEMECRALKFCKKTMVHCRRAENRRKTDAWTTRLRGQRSQKLASARYVMVSVIAMLTASLVSL
jgi:hypothetical protein